ATADALVRAAAAPAEPMRASGRPDAHVPWERRLVAALAAPEADFAPAGFQERILLAELEAWARPAVGAEPGMPRACFRLGEPGEAWAFLTDAAPALAEAGMGVILPAELTRSGQRRLRLRMRVGGGTAGAAGTVAGASGLSFNEVVSFRWEATLAGEMLSARELVALARLKAPLVRFRGQWVAVDPKELEGARRLLAAGGATLAAHEAGAVAPRGPARPPGAGAPLG